MISKLYHTTAGSLLGQSLFLFFMATAVGHAEEGSVEAKGATIGRMGESATVDPDNFDFSSAESKLWMADHLHNISRPVRLYYEFEKSGSFELGFADSVYLDIIAINEDGSKNADLQFLTGERQQPFAPDNVTDIRGNPVLGVYMRGDIHDMNRLTNGSWRYFQRQIKLAFANAASVEPVMIDYDGHSVPGELISITPYANDPRRRQFEQFADKRYEFFLSDQIPGTIYRIRTTIPNMANPDREPLIQETLTLRAVETGS